MAKDTVKLAWTDVDPETLPVAMQEAYAAYKAKYREAKALKEAFEVQIQALAPEGKRIACAYNFGKLSIALADAREAKSAPQGKQSLADWIAQQTAGGRRG